MRQKISTTGITSNEQMTYYLLTEEEALADMKKTIEEVNEILGLPSTTLVRLILNHFRWDKNTLTEQFYNDSEQLFKKLNVANPYLSPSIQWDPLSPAIVPMRDPFLVAAEQSTSTTCRTCCSEKSPSEFQVLPCRHQHCTICWQIYLESTIAGNDYGQCISCPSRCNQIIDDDEILKLLAHNEKLRQRYLRYLVETFVQSNRLTNWCPGNGCSTIVKMKSYTPKCAQMIECDMCKLNFCFQCTRQWHEPMKCSLLQKWDMKNQDESMTGKWSPANTKGCPKCLSNIEKNGGCNHMTCRTPGCGHEFCWICFGDWRGHESRQCNVYHQETNEQAQTSARKMLGRYMHYFTRYKTHDQLLELESRRLEQLEARMREMNAGSMSFTDRQAFLKAFEGLQRCRRTLKFTYPFAYYLERNNQVEVFEANQADLERATEVLSGYLEHDIDREKISAITLMDKTRSCDRRREILLDHCKEGYREHHWIRVD